MVGVAQLVELRIVIPVVAGSNPVVHPISKDAPRKPPLTNFQIAIKLQYTVV